MGDPQAVRRAAAAAKKERAQKNGKGAVVEMNGGDGVDGASTVQQGGE